VNNKKGFSLIELIVVIMVSMVLIGLGVVAINAVQKSQKNMQRKSNINDVKTAIEAYKADNGSYPVADTAQNVANGSAFVTTLATGGYLKSYNYVDPDGATNASCYSSNGGSYKLYAYKVGTTPASLCSSTVPAGVFDLSN
jgi:type II secretory pathway pseudopilin PulG